MNRHLNARVITDVCASCFRSLVGVDPRCFVGVVHGVSGWLGETRIHNQVQRNSVWSVQGLHRQYRLRSGRQQTQKCKRRSENQKIRISGRMVKTGFLLSCKDSENTSTLTGVFRPSGCCVEKNGVHSAAVGCATHPNNRTVAQHFNSHGRASAAAVLLVVNIEF